MLYRINLDVTIYNEQSIIYLCFFKYSGFRDVTIRTTEPASGPNPAIEQPAISRIDTFYDKVKHLKWRTAVICVCRFRAPFPHNMFAQTSYTPRPVLSFRMAASYPVSGSSNHKKCVIKREFRPNLSTLNDCEQRQFKAVTFQACNYLRLASRRKPRSTTHDYP